MDRQSRIRAEPNPNGTADQLIRQLGRAVDERPREPLQWIARLLRVAADSWPGTRGSRDGTAGGPVSSRTRARGRGTVAIPDRGLRVGGDIVQGSGMQMNCPDGYDSATVRSRSIADAIQNSTGTEC